MKRGQGHVSRVSMLGGWVGEKAKVRGRGSRARSTLVARFTLGPFLPGMLPPTHANPAAVGVTRGQPTPKRTVVVVVAAKQESGGTAHHLREESRDLGRYLDLLRPTDAAEPAQTGCRGGRRLRASTEVSPSTLGIVEVAIISLH